MKVFYSKRGNESIKNPLVQISAVVIFITAFVLTFSFVINAGGNTESFLPAYVRDVGNILEGMTSTSADVSVVYQFTDPVALSYQNHKLTLTQKKADVSNKVYLPNDVTVTVQKESLKSKFFLFSKKGKNLLLAPIGLIKDEEIQVQDITNSCPEFETDVAVKTTISQLQSLEEKYPEKNNAYAVSLTDITRTAGERDIIVYYDNTRSSLGPFLCNLRLAIEEEFSMSPVLVGTSYDEILGTADVILSFQSYHYTASKMETVLDKARGEI